MGRSVAGNCCMNTDAASASAPQRLCHRRASGGPGVLCSRVDSRLRGNDLLGQKHLNMEEPSPPRASGGPGVLCSQVDSRLRGNDVTRDGWLARGSRQ